MGKTTSAILFLSAAAVIGGCRDSNAPLEPSFIPYGNTREVYVDGPDVRRATNIDEAPTMFKDPYGLLHVHVPLRSRVDDHAITLQYRVTWFDISHHIVDVEGWQDKSLTPRVPDQIDLTSPVKADDFRMDLRRPRLDLQ